VYIYRSWLHAVLGFVRVNWDGVCIGHRLFVIDGMNEIINDVLDDKNNTPQDTLVPSFDGRTPTHACPTMNNGQLLNCNRHKTEQATTKHDKHIKRTDHKLEHLKTYRNQFVSTYKPIDNSNLLRYWEYLWDVQITVLKYACWPTGYKLLWR